MTNTDFGVIITPVYHAKRGNIMSEQRKLRVGVIGCGRISVMHFVSIGAIDEVELVACCDIKKERAESAAKEYGIKAYTSYEEMLDTEDLDAVHLCLPHYLHSKVAVAAFERGVHVLTEKPMDIDYATAENAVKRAKELGVTYGVIFQCRYNNSARLVKEAVELTNKHLPTFKHIQVTELRDTEFEKTTTRKIKRFLVK